MTTSLTPTDRFALADLTARYAAAVDRREFDQLRQVFVPEATLDTGRAVRQGIDEILAAMEGLRRYDATSHLLGQQLLDEHEAGECRGHTYCEAHHLRVDDEGQRTDQVMHIRYHDVYVHTDGGWRIKTRRLEVVWTDDRSVG